MKRSHAVLGLLLAAGLGFALLRGHMGQAAETPAHTERPSPSPVFVYPTERSREPDENGFFFTGADWVRVEWAAGTLMPELLAQHQPEVTCTVGWADGASGDEALRSTAEAYVALLARLQAKPDEIPAEVSCCTEELLEEARLRGFLGSDALYHQLIVDAALDEPQPLGGECVQVRLRGLFRMGYTPCCAEYIRSTARPWAMEWDFDWLLTLERENDRWCVTGSDMDECDTLGYASGYATEKLPDHALRQTVDAYFRMRADEAAGGMGDSGCTTSALLADAKDFARSLALDRPLEARCAACHYGEARWSGGYCTLQVTEALRVTCANRCVFLTIEHTLLLKQQENGENCVVVGDLYRYGDHACSIVDYLN